MKERKMEQRDRPENNKRHWVTCEKKHKKQTKRKERRFLVFHCTNDVCVRVSVFDPVVWCEKRRISMLTGSCRRLSGPQRASSTFCSKQSPQRHTKGMMGCGVAGVCEGVDSQGNKEICTRGMKQTSPCWIVLQCLLPVTDFLRNTF